VNEQELEDARSLVRAVLLAADNANHAGEQAVLAMAKASALMAALVKIRALCPATDPGPATDPVWGDWISSGNTDDVAADYRAEGLWEVAVICDAVLPTPSSHPGEGQ
jgi:hypothetical protein